jgi:DNA modification methylase
LSERRLIIHGGVLETLRGEPDASFDALYSDVPYGLGPKQPTGAELIAYLQGEELDTRGDFMGKRWSVPSVNVWKEIFRVLKPGAPLFVNAAPRTEDLVALGMRAAGFEIADVIMWMFAEAMPKSVNLSKAIDREAGAEREVIGHQRLTGSAAVKGGVRTVGAGTAPAIEIPITAPATDLAKAWDGYGSALAPGYEPVIFAWKPNEGTYVENVAKHGVGGIAIDATRIGFANDADESESKSKNQHGDFGSGPTKNRVYGGFKKDRDNYEAPGRWPKNIILDEAVGAQLDAVVGNRPGMSGGGQHRADYGGGMFGAIDSTTTARGDNGGPSRFYFCAKSGRAERDLGCEHLPLRFPGETVGRIEGSEGIKSGRAGAGRTGEGVRNHHPNVKAIALTTYIARMGLPPSRSTPRRLLVPYCGSGSEIVGALLAGWDFVLGIDFDADYVAIANARTKLAMENPRAFDPEARATKTAEDARQTTLFGKVGS